MTYAALETSIEGAAPVEIFEFTAGTFKFFYTSAEDDVTVGAQLYTAVPGFERGENTEGPERREDDFEITLPTVDPLAQLFTGVLPGFRIRVQVRRFHRTDLPTPEVVQIFDGYIQSASFRNNLKETLLTARTVIASIGRQIPRRTYQSSCNHVLYDPGTCKVNDTLPAYRAAALNVSSMIGNDLVVTSGLSGSYPDGFMAGGFVEVIGVTDYRTIRVHVGNTLTLMLPFSVTPSTVNVFAGCAHTIQVCKSKFNNVNRYGGFAFVPTRNVFETGLIS